MDFYVARAYEDYINSDGHWTEYEYEGIIKDVSSKEDLEIKLKDFVENSLKQGYFYGHEKDITIDKNLSHDTVSISAIDKYYDNNGMNIRFQVFGSVEVIDEYNEENYGHNYFPNPRWNYKIPEYDSLPLISKEQAEQSEIQFQSKAPEMFKEISNRARDIEKIKLNLEKAEKELDDIKSRNAAYIIKYCEKNNITNVEITTHKSDSETEGIDLDHIYAVDVTDGINIFFDVNNEQAKVHLSLSDIKTAFKDYYLSEETFDNFLLNASKEKKTLEFHDLLSKQIRSDKEKVLEMVKIRGDALEYMSDELKDDRDVVLAAVTNSPFAYEYTSKRIRYEDKEIALIAVKGDAEALNDMSYELMADKEIMYEALKHGKQYIDILTYDLQDEIEEAGGYNSWMERTKNELENNNNKEAKEMNENKALENILSKKEGQKSDYEVNPFEVIKETREKNKYDEMFASARRMSEADKQIQGAGIEPKQPSVDDAPIGFDWFNIVNPKLKPVLPGA